MDYGHYELHVLIRPDLARQAKASAAAADLGLSSWVRLAIREKLDRDAGRRYEPDPLIIHGLPERSKV